MRGLGRQQGVAQSSLPTFRENSEAGATVRFNCLLREMNVAVRAEDERRIEVLASGLPLFHGAQLALDITLRGAQAGSCPSERQRL